MNFLSVCSGIDAASIAWRPLGWRAVAFSEIEKFPCELLAHHYPDVQNFGDMTKFKEWPDANVDVLVGGTPCQSFSVAGLRKGLADPRGNLALTYLGIADKYRPKWVLWENVPGVLSSNGGRDFGAFLGGLVELGYGFAYRVLDAQFVRVDGFGRAVPQRRRRVFVVGCLGDWRRAAAVLFDAAGMYGDSAPRREAGKGAAPTLAARTRGGGGLGTDFDCDGGLVYQDVAHCLNAGGMGRIDYETETFVAHQFGAMRPSRIGSTVRAQGGDNGLGSETLVAHALRAEGFDASEDGTGRGTPIVPVAYAINSHAGTADGEQTNMSHASGGPVGLGIQEGCAYSIRAGRTQAVATPIAFSCKDHSADAGDISPTLRSMGHDGSHANAGGQVAIAIQAGATRENPSSGLDGVGVQKGIAYTLEARAEVQAVQNGWAVRRLTPLECERLQGFPDGYTNISRNGKPAADGPRYKSLGNSMAVNVMRWVGQRIAEVENL